MHGTASCLLESPVRRDATLEREFEAGLADSGRLAFRVAYSVLRHREDAEDVAQEALVKAYRRLAWLRRSDRLGAWLVRISWRLALDHRRAAQRRDRRERLADPPTPRPDAEELLAAGEQRQELLRAVEALPEKLRVVVVLTNLEGHGIREVASLLSLPEGTVKSRLHLARRRLLESLQ